MKPTKDTQGIECKAPIGLKVLPLVVWALLGLAYRPVGSGIDILVAVIWFFLGFGYFAGIQDFVFYDTGVEIHIWWMRTFVEWKHIKGAYQYKLRTQLDVTQTTPLNDFMKAFVSSGLGIIWTYSNYDRAVQLLEERLGDRFFSRVPGKD